MNKIPDDIWYGCGLWQLQYGRWGLNLKDNMKPTREEVCEALIGIRDLALIAAVHHCMTRPIPGLMKVTAWLKSEYQISGEQVGIPDPITTEEGVCL